MSRGGYRPGAGRPKKDASATGTPPTFDLGGLCMDPKKFLLAVMNSPSVEVRLRIESAKALMPYEHPKLGEFGKKDAAQDASNKASTGKFAPGAPPRLVVSDGKPIK